ncbi:19903_t:CDS:2 [Dentiscutata erythropus]|uniref:19903_t:CDS:1 n=1 Tax=Dentiscutata erythropus TaxID=1348616 RepID=A0A9N9GPL8_9GLOM|nr:19903_t:CDS:2 [Dentiscutata erythropus]
MDYDVNDGNNWNNDGTWNIANDNAIEGFYTWPDNYKTTESSSWDTSDDKTVVASPVYNWPNNNDFEDFFENSLERFKNDLFRVFTDFYYEWQGLSNERTSTSQKQIVNGNLKNNYILYLTYCPLTDSYELFSVNEIDGELVIHVELPGFRKENIIVDVCRDDTRGGDVLTIRDKDWDTQPLYGRFLGTIVFPYKIDAGKSQLFLEQGTLDLKKLLDTSHNPPSTYHQRQLTGHEQIFTREDPELIHLDENFKNIKGGQIKQESRKAKDSELGKLGIDTINMSDTLNDGEGIKELTKRNLGVNQEHYAVDTKPD